MVAIQGTPLGTLKGLVLYEHTLAIDHPVYNCVSLPIHCGNCTAMVFNLASPTLNAVVEPLGLRMAANEVGRGGVHTHNSSLHPRLFFFIATHSRLMGIASRANRRKTIIDFGAGDGNFLFVAASQSCQRRTILGIELDEERVEQLDQRLGLLIKSGLPVNCPEYVQEDFTSNEREDVNLEPYDHAIANGEIICWFNNAKDVMTREKTYSIDSRDACHALARDLHWYRWTAAFEEIYHGMKRASSSLCCETMSRGT